jgi:DNA-binding FadR family transcriptional regulator
LGRLIHAMENAAEARAVHELVREDVVFHRKICEIAANRRLLRTWIGVIGQIHLLSRHVIETLYEDLHIIAQRHDLIREAILGGNEDVAERVVRDHIDSVARRVLLTL